MSLRRWWFCSFLGLHVRPAWRRFGAFTCVECGAAVTPPNDL